MIADADRRQVKPFDVCVLEHEIAASGKFPDNSDLN